MGSHSMFLWGAVFLTCVHISLQDLLCVDVTNATKPSKECMNQASVGDCSNGSLYNDAAVVKPNGLQHCRAQFSHFPCCDLQKDGDPSGSKHITCDSVITNQFEPGTEGRRGGHFACDDLLMWDEDALFFFVKELQTKPLSYQCVSVCHTNTGRSVVGGLVWVLVLVVAAKQLHG